MAQIRGVGLEKSEDGPQDGKSKKDVTKDRLAPRWKFQIGQTGRFDDLREEEEEKSNSYEYQAKSRKRSAFEAGIENIENLDEMVGVH